MPGLANVAGRPEQQPRNLSHFRRKVGRVHRLCKKIEIETLSTSLFQQICGTGLARKEKNLAVSVRLAKMDGQFSGSTVAIILTNSTLSWTHRINEMPNANRCSLNAEERRHDR